MTKESNFAKLTAIDVNEHIEKKETKNATLSYLSWAWAWDYFKKTYPDAKYEIKEWDGKPYLFDEKTGYLVETSITAGGETHLMWLPVMDSTNHALTDKPYTVKNKFGQVSTVKAANMFDINKSIMRCLVKNMAMFGLGLYIYAGEDLPSNSSDKEVQPVENEQKTEKPVADKLVVARVKKCNSEKELTALWHKLQDEMGDNFADVKGVYTVVFAQRKAEIAKAGATNANN